MPPVPRFPCDERQTVSLGDLEDGEKDCYNFADEDEGLVQQFYCENNLRQCKSQDISPLPSIIKSVSSLPSLVGAQMPSPPVFSELATAVIGASCALGAFVLSVTGFILRKRVKLWITGRAQTRQMDFELSVRAVPASLPALPESLNNINDQNGQVEGWLRTARGEEIVESDYHSIPEF